VLILFSLLYRHVCDRFYGGSAEVTMAVDNDVSFWGGWAGQYGAVAVTAKFLLISSGVPVTSSPTPSTTIAPTSTATDTSFSVSFEVATTGVTSTALHLQVSALGEVFCTHLELSPALCLITFVSNAQLTTDDLQFDLLVTDFASRVGASDASTALQQYVLDSSAEGFIEEFFNASSLRFTVAAYQSSEVTESSTAEGNIYAYSCDLSDHLKISWRVESQGDGLSTGEAGGYITGSLTMMSAGSTPWFAAGVVQSDALAMVESPEHVVYFYEPNSQQAGMYRINAYSSSGIVADTRIRADTGVLGKHSSLSSTSIDFQQS
jgi:hypothetical protein